MSDEVSAGRPPESVRAELVGFLESDRTRLGEVYRLTERGLRPPEIAAELGVRTSGFVSNNRTHVRALLDGVVPHGASIAMQTGSQVRRVLEDRGLSPEAVAYCTGLLRDLLAVSTSGSSSAPGARRQPADTVPPTVEDGSEAAEASRPNREDQNTHVDAFSPSVSVSTEVRDLVRNDSSRLGQVFRLTEDGLGPEQIAKELGVSTSNFVSNNRIIARALIEGVAPRGDSLKRAAAAKARSVLRTMGLSPEAREYFGLLIDAFATHGARTPSTRRVPSQPRAPSPTGEPSERRLRGMLASLVQRIEVETDVAPSDYEALAARTDVTASLSRHVGRSKASGTFLALYERGRLDLTLESFVVRFGRGLGISDQDRQMAEDRLMYFSELD